MKKVIILLAFMLITLTGCGDYKLEDAIKDFSKSVESSKSYKINGTMQIMNGEEVFTYNIDTYFLKDDYYKVVLVNQTNNHEQIILKNKEGLYVVTPSLNKSFKFDSVWPANSSQAYILQNLVEDIKDDNKVEFSKEDNGYIIKSKVNYPNNEELVYQKIYFNKDMKIEKVEVFNESDIAKIKVSFKNVDLKAKLKEDDFLLEDLIDEEMDNNKDEVPNNDKNDINKENEPNDSNKENNQNSCNKDNCDKKTSVLENIIYPLYIPSNTHLAGSEKIDTDTSERVILTFSGEKNFVIVEETVVAPKDFEIIPVFGEPLMLDETIGALSSNSVSWHKDNISYYLVSSDLSSSEMVNVAKSLGNSKTVISTK